MFANNSQLFYILTVKWNLITCWRADFYTVLNKTLWLFKSFRVDDTYLVKIADFGMSRDVYVYNYYREGKKDKPKPAKWMAIESLREGVYDSYSEVVR